MTQRYNEGDIVRIVGVNKHQENVREADIGTVFQVTHYNPFDGGFVEGGKWRGGVWVENIELANPVPEDQVASPSHYQHPSGIEVIEITKHETFVRGNIIKYVLRAPFKGTELLDLKKARQYLDWEIERVEATSEDQ